MNRENTYWKLPKDRNYTDYYVRTGDRGEIFKCRMETNKGSYVQRWLQRHSQEIK